MGQRANGNASRLVDVSLALRGWNKPFVMAADFNCDLLDLADVGYLGYIPAQAVARARARDATVRTCRSPQDNYSNVDFWLVSLSLAGSFTAARPVPGWSAAPRHPMMTALAARAKAAKLTALAGPRAFPRQEPPEEAILVADTGRVDPIEADVAHGGEATPAGAQARLDGLYTAFINSAEQELVHACGLEKAALLRARILLLHPTFGARGGLHRPCPTSCFVMTCALMSFGDSSVWCPLVPSGRTMILSA
ncbi:unnamed protein product, partial [Prorocentrum cordatum]